MHYEVSYCFEHPNELLYSGFYKIMNTPTIPPDSNLPLYQGNYVINHSDLYYTGEAENISARIKQQFNARTSTFYKRYLKECKGKQIMISDFNLRVIQTNISRKELEEFCIVNLPARLNKFQLGKQNLYIGNADSELWDWMQANQEKCLIYLQNKFGNCSFYSWNKAKIGVGAGVYLIEHKNDGLIYIGESSDINARYQTHSGDTRFSAFRRNIATQLLGINLKTKSELG